ncbi:MAG: hypothetical protein EZS28_026559 [Streblomastix strix]|uniref:Transmembrane protein n=1 Tax=Streblomastix strix TaxID=222440 RepID=A0A5J4V690_9EUKA|nr:MAG: hypothetical protein EZS28_026559 [Streblomastix strix]
MINTYGSVTKFLSYRSYSSVSSNICCYSISVLLTDIAIDYYYYEGGISVQQQKKVIQELEEVKVKLNLDLMNQKQNMALEMEYQLEMDFELEILMHAIDIQVDLNQFHYYMKKEMEFFFMDQLIGFLILLFIHYYYYSILIFFDYFNFQSGEIRAFDGSCECDSGFDLKDMKFASADAADLEDFVYLDEDQDEDEDLIGSLFIFENIYFIPIGS